MGCEVYANGMTIACKVADGKTIAAMPDVCLSPPTPPAGPVPLPYPNTAMASDTTKGSKSVQIGGQEVMLKNKSTFKKSTGDEAATKTLGMGVVSHQIQGEVSFCAWSMDVKFEGENVPRHLDLTLHNEMCDPANVPPWPYTDSAAVQPGGGGDCAKEAEAMVGKCKSPIEQDTSPECCSVPQRQCVLIPKSRDKDYCCSNHGTTGHHVIPKQEVCKEGTAGSPLDGNPNYKHNDAPCVCADGGNPGVRDSNGNIKKHAIFHNAFKQGRTQHINNGNSWDYPALKTVSSEAVAKETGCTAKCIEHQVAHYHDGKITEVRISEQKSYDPTPRPPNPVEDF